MIRSFRVGHGSRNLFVLALAGCATALAFSAQAVESKRGNADLKKYCTGDYLSYCSIYKPDDPATDACFKTNWAKLSENCRRAIDFYAPPKGSSRKRG